MPRSPRSPSARRRGSMIERIELAPGYEHLAASSRVAGSWPAATARSTRRRCWADMAAYVDAGITAFDCADIYTGVESADRFDFRRDMLARGASITGESASVHTKFVPDSGDALGDDRPQPTCTRLIDRSLRAPGRRTARSGSIPLVGLRASPAIRRGRGYGCASCRRTGADRRCSAEPISTMSARRARCSAAGVRLIATMQVQYSVLDTRPAGLRFLCRTVLSSERHAAAVLRNRGRRISERASGAAFRNPAGAAREPLAGEVQAHHRR